MELCTKLRSKTNCWVRFLMSRLHLFHSQLRYVGVSGAYERHNGAAIGAQRRQDDLPRTGSRIGIKRQRIWMVRSLQGKVSVLCVEFTHLSYYILYRSSIKLEIGEWHNELKRFDSAFESFLLRPRTKNAYASLLFSHSRGSKERSTISLSLLLMLSSLHHNHTN